MDLHSGHAGIAEAKPGEKRGDFRIGFLGAAMMAGLVAIAAWPASAEKAAPSETPVAAEIALPSLGRHVRRAARLPFNVSLNIEEEKAVTAAGKSPRPSLARFVRARGHGSEATTVDGYGPDRLVESVTFPADAPLSRPRSTALADSTKSAAPGL